MSELWLLCVLLWGGKIKNNIMHYTDTLLHTHLEGSVPYEVLCRICERNSIFYYEKEFYEYKKKDVIGVDWSEFRKIFFSICSCLLSAEDYYDVVVGYGEKLKEDGIKRAEFHFSPWKHMSRGVSCGIFEKGLFDGLEYLKKECDFDGCIIVDFIRKKDEQVGYILDWVKDNAGQYIKGVGISGGVNSIDRKEYTYVVNAGRRMGLNVVAHAGEIESYDSVLEVIEYYEPDRISHGINSVYSKNVIEKIKERNIHLEICPTANRKLGIISEKLFEIKRLIEEGISISINTDDELIFNTSIQKEYDDLYELGVIDCEILKKINDDTIKNSFI